MKNILVGLSLLFAMSSSFAGSQVNSAELNSLKNISQELVKVRQQIETLHNDIGYEKASFKDQMRSYSNQKSDLDVRISRAELNIKDLQRELKKLTDINKKKNQLHDDVAPVLENSIDAIRVTVAASLPFKLQQRLNALDEIEHRFKSNIISPNKAINQLWAYVEDELMMGKSSGIYSDTMTINGRELLVKVLRIGKVSMFYKTPDAQFGVTKLQNGKWQQQMFEDSGNIAQLEQLFDSFSKNIRNGKFVMPNFLPRS